MTSLPQFGIGSVKQKKQRRWSYLKLSTNIIIANTIGNGLKALQGSDLVQF